MYCIVTATAFVSEIARSPATDSATATVAETPALLLLHVLMLCQLLLFVILQSSSVSILEVFLTKLLGYKMYNNSQLAIYK